MEQATNEQQQSAEKFKHIELRRFLNFSLGTDEYAVPISSVREVLALPEITPVPFTPAHFQGIMNLRGQVISVIDLRIKMGVPSANSQETAIIICEIGHQMLGIIVSSINSVLALDKDSISPNPPGNESKHLKYVAGIAKFSGKMILIVDTAKLLDDGDLEAMSRVASITN